MSSIDLPHHHCEWNPELNKVADIDSFQKAADIFRLLGDGSRLRIFWLLCHCEECVINISSLVKYEQPGSITSFTAIKNKRAYHKPQRWKRNVL